MRRESKIASESHATAEVRLRHEDNLGKKQHHLTISDVLLRPDSVWGRRDSLHSEWTIWRMYSFGSLEIAGGLSSWRLRHK
jgi:hypothetical protein